MPELFGLDIQKIVADAVTAAGGLTDGTLIKTTPGARDAARPSRRAASTTTNHTFQGVVETKQFRRENTAIAETLLTILIITGTISPMTTPEVNDTVTIFGCDLYAREAPGAGPGGGDLSLQCRLNQAAVREVSILRQYLPRPLHLVDYPLSGGL